MRGFDLPFDNGLRILHIALWLTIPTVFWLWLASPPAAECVPQYGWYQGNVLCVSEDIHLFIIGGLFLIGFFAIPFWMAGYWIEIIHCLLDDDKKLPPVRRRIVGKGYALFWTSLGYWLPTLAYVLCTKAASHVLPHEAALHVFDTVMLVSLPFMLLMFWGYLVSLARYAASGERAWFGRRRESMRMALANIRLTLLLTVQLIAAAALCVAVWFGVFVMPIPWRRLDFMSDAALGSLSFYVALLCCILACSHLVARYASKIGIGDYIKDSERLGSARSDEVLYTTHTVLE